MKIIEKTAVSLIVALTIMELVQDALSCPEEIYLKPDGNVVYDGYSAGINGYDINFTSFTPEFPSRRYLNGTPMIPIGPDGVISLSECQCKSRFFCIRKCCSLKSTMDIYYGRCMDAEIFALKGTKTRRSPYNISKDNAPCSGTCSAGDELFITFLESGIHFILKDGHLCTTYGYGPTCFSPGDFCIEYLSSPRVLAVASCRNATGTQYADHKWEFFFTNWGFFRQITEVFPLISVISLTGTFLVYSCFRELQNLHGKCLLCHIASFIAYFVLIIAKKYREDRRYITNDWICFTLDLAEYYFHLTPFSWLNVICVDITMSFMKLRPRHGNSLKAEWIKFAYYSLYSWTTPLLAIFSFMIVVSSYGELDLSNWSISEWCNIDADDTVEDDSLIAISVYMGISVVLFVTTAIRIYRINASTSILRSGERVQRSEEDENKYRSFKIYTKLLVIMGFMSWVIEPVYWVVRDQAYYYWARYTFIAFVVIRNFRNLHGVYISLLFLWNDKIRNLVKKKLLNAWKSIIQRCIPRPRNFEPVIRPESFSHISPNPTSSLVTVTTSQGSQRNISESGYTVSGSQGNLRDFSVLTGKPAEDALSTSLEGSSCPVFAPLDDAHGQVSFSPPSRSHEISRL